MDKEYHKQIVELLEKLIGENEPSDAELDYDENWIAVYDCLHDLKKAYEDVGLM